MNRDVEKMQFVPAWQSSNGPSEWHLHLPFAYQLVALLKPKLLVELGTFDGDSYFSFCQSVIAHNLGTRCYAIGNASSELRSSKIAMQKELEAYNQLHYSAFSYLLNATPDEAIIHFADGSIDLLHIDGIHSYQAIQQHFGNWLPKIRAGGIVLLHDVCNRSPESTVWKFWQELQQQHDTVLLPHGQGLGVLRTDSDGTTQADLAAFLAPMIESPEQVTTEKIAAEVRKYSQELELERLKEENLRLKAAHQQMSVEQKKCEKMLEHHQQLDTDYHLANHQISKLKAEHIITSARLTETLEEKGKLQHRSIGLEESNKALVQAFDRGHSSTWGPIRWQFVAALGGVNSAADMLRWKLWRAMARFFPLLIRNQKKGWRQKRAAYSIELTEPAAWQLNAFGQRFAGFCSPISSNTPRGIRVRFGRQTFLGNVQPVIRNDDRLHFQFAIEVPLTAVGWHKYWIDVLTDQGVWLPVGSYLGFLQIPAGLADDGSTLTKPVRDDDDLSSAVKDFGSIEAENARVLEFARKYAVQVTPVKPHPLRAIAFYLPQFHPIPENDAWWGKGFTEWSNVTRAKKLFESHYQPHLPADLGFYDLRIPEIRQQQAELARSHGIHGFCYYHYWFGGRKLLEQPFQAVLQSGQPDFPFCICWANEHWSRTWDGDDSTILYPQEHTLEDSKRFIEDLLPALRDERYIRVNGKAVLLVYQVGLIPNPAETAVLWREICYKEGIGELYLCSVQTYENEDPRPSGFDAAVEFPPHRSAYTRTNERPATLNEDFDGQFFDYRKMVEGLVQLPDPEYPLLRGIMPAWDNTARKSNTPNMWLHSSPELYEAWLSAIAAKTGGREAEEERLLFINAWNEWAEGCHLEPDQKYGKDYLDATARVLRVPSLEISSEPQSTNVQDEFVHSNYSASQHGVLSDRLAAFNTEQWIQCLLGDEQYADIAVPGFPDEDLQRAFVGSAGEKALREIRPFYEIILSRIERYAAPLTPEAKVLDFGTGWARILRFFLRHVPAENLVGIDVQPKMIELCQKNFPAAQFQTIDPHPPTLLADGEFDLITAYSVFSHLNEQAATAWIEEMQRLLKPGGLLFFTTQRESFIEYCQELRSTGHLTHSWHENLVRCWVDTDVAHRDFHEGKFMHVATGGENLSAEFYGETIIPPGYVTRNWNSTLKFREYLDEPQLAQALYILQKSP